MNKRIIPSTDLDPLPALSLEQRAEVSRRAWKNLWLSLVSITPGMLGQTILWLAALSAILWLVVASWPALLPFMIGGVLAYIVLPFVNILDRFLPRLLAALLGVFLMLFCLGALLYVIVPPLVSQTLVLLQKIPPDATIQSLSDSLIANVQSLPPRLRDFAIQAITDTSVNLNEKVNAVFPSLVSLQTLLRLLNAIGFVLGLIVMPTWLLTVLQSWPKAKQTLNRQLPAGLSKDFWAVLRIIDKSFGIFFRGQVLTSFVVGILTYLGLEFMIYLGAPQGAYPVTFAVLAGLLQLIPDVGPLVNTLLVAFLAYRSDPVLAVYVIALYLGIQYLVNRLVKDRIEERIIDVNPALLVLFIVALWQIGFVWLFLAAPLAGMSRDLFLYLHNRLDQVQPLYDLPPLEMQSADQPLDSAAKPLPMIYRRLQNPPDSRQ